MENNQIIVLITKGKSDSIESVQIKIFQNVDYAYLYCIENTDAEDKYWTYCQVIKEDKEVENLNPRLF